MLVFHPIVGTTMKITNILLTFGIIGFLVLFLALSEKDSPETKASDLARVTPEMKAKFEDGSPSRLSVALSQEYLLSYPPVLSLFSCNHKKRNTKAPLTL